MKNEEILNNKKKIIIILSAIAVILIALIVLLVIKLINLKTNKNDNENIIENKTIENVVEENTLEENIINEIVTDEIEDEEYINENPYKSDNTPVADPTQEIDQQTYQTEKSNEEKAVEIVRKDWGNDSSVNIAYTGYRDDNGIYYVEVRKETYLVKMYKVNVENGTFETE